MADPIEVPQGWITFRYAAILDRFHLTPTALAALTDLQLDALYFYPRTSEGALDPPAFFAAPVEPIRPPTAQDRLTMIARLEADRLIAPQKAAELREQVTRGGTTSGDR